MKQSNSRPKALPVVRLGLAFALLVAPVFAQQDKSEHELEFSRYKVTDLGTLGGTFSMAFGVNNAGRVGGAATVPAGNQHAFIWYRGHMSDLGTLGGPNSVAGAPSGEGRLAIISDTSSLDPSGEDFCGFGTHLVCLGAVWNGESLTALSTLGGNNATALTINNRGQVVGYAENGTPDKTCALATPSQVFQYEAVIWDRHGRIHQLPPLPGDTVGFALGINDRGQAVGSTGVCANTPLFPLQIGPHAVLWERGLPINLGSLGGGDFNTAAAINNRAEVVGASEVAGTLHTFLWTEDNGMQDLGTVGADLGSLPGGMEGINNQGQIVGASCINDPLCNLANPNLQTRAYLWQKGKMRDLNSLVVGKSPLYLLLGFGINDVGEIAGYGITPAGEIHGFLAIPCGQDGEDLCAADAVDTGGR
jgi:probable HAF family extracellular repeat protein